MNEWMNSFIMDEIHPTKRVQKKWLHKHGIYMKNQNIKSKEQIKETIVLFSNNCYPLGEFVYNLWTIVNKLQCFNISQHKKWATTHK
jgi:cation transport regulator ChaC